VTGVQAGAILAALLAGAAVASVAVGRWADRFGLRRTYLLLLALMAAAGTVFALTSSVPALAVAALTGTVSTDVVESGPFTSLEQAMLSYTAGDTTRVLGIYNSVAVLAGSLGALIAFAASSPRWLLVYPLTAALALPAAARLSPAVEVERSAGAARAGLGRSRGMLLRIGALFALDSFGGGFIPQAFVAYVFTRRYGASPHTLAVLFFAIGLLQIVSFQLAVHVSARFGPLRTIVFSQLPSNLLLVGVAFAPTLTIAIALLLGRFFLSHMDVPTRQAYVVEIVEPAERAAAAAYTNAARYTTRPVAPLLSGLALGAGLGVPFLAAGTLKIGYDVSLYLTAGKFATGEPGGRRTAR